MRSSAAPGSASRDGAPAPAANPASPRPTYAPAMMALGVTMMFWGATTMWIMSAVGAGLIACSLWIWIDEIRQSSRGGKSS